MGDHLQGIRPFPMEYTDLWSLVAFPPWEEPLQTFLNYPSFVRMWVARTCHKTRNNIPHIHMGDLFQIIFGNKNVAILSDMGNALKTRDLKMKVLSRLKHPNSESVNTDLNRKLNKQALKFTKINRKKSWPINTITETEPESKYTFL